MNIICICGHVIEKMINKMIRIDGKQTTQSEYEEVKCFACGRILCVTVQTTVIEPSTGG